VSAGNGTCDWWTDLAGPVCLGILSIPSASLDADICACDYVEPLGKNRLDVSHEIKILSEAGPVHRIVGAHAQRA
jgi:ArsR family transcriptional regulator